MAEPEPEPAAAEEARRVEAEEGTPPADAALARSATAPAATGTAFSRDGLSRTQTAPDRSGWLRDISALSAASQMFRLEATMLAAKLEARAEEDIGKHPTAMVERFAAQSCNLTGCVFVGHTNTDMDSVASAIAAADLYEGTAARSAAGGDDPREVNGEILHALKFSDLPLPEFFQDLPDATETSGPPVCFVDTNHPTQMIAPMGTKEHLHRIKGIIDHHNCALETPSPIYVDIRPWGSCCSIIAHHYIRNGKQMPLPIARVLLCGILSDTINLMSPTTTDADRLMMVVLKILARVEDLDKVAQLQFKAKTASFVAMAPFALVRADMKCFSQDAAGKAVRFAWCATPPAPIITCVLPAHSLLFMRLMS